MQLHLVETPCHLMHDLKTRQIDLTPNKPDPPLMVRDRKLPPMGKPCKNWAEIKISTGFNEVGDLTILNMKMEVIHHISKP